MSYTIKITGFIASIVAILSFVLSLYATDATDATYNFTNNGSVGTVNQTKNINNTTNNYFNDSKVVDYTGGYVVSETRGLSKEESIVIPKQLCTVYKNTKIELIEKGNFRTKVKILDGDCANTIGWLESKAIEKK